MKTSSLWIDTAARTAFPKLEKDLRVDALVVGGGITGLTAAYLLRKAGRSVAVVERGRIGGGETGHTTAHVTYATDERLSELVKRFGRNHAQAAWDAGATAMAQIREIVAEARIDCELRTVPAFLVAAASAENQEGDRLREEAALAAELGFNATFVENAPIFGRPAMRLANQLKFHPEKYVQALAREIVHRGGQVFEETDVAGFEDEPSRVIAGGHSIAFDFAVVATHTPLQGNTGTLSAALFQTKLAGYSTYAIEARVPAGTLPQIMCWDTADPYLYLRVDSHSDGEVVILGGEDHKTGQETDTEACYARLEEMLHTIVPGRPAVERRWSGQVIESVDGLPYIGEAENGQFVATGFAGNGMTFGTLAGMMACDAAMGAQNPWCDLFAVERKTLSATWDYLRENSDYPFYLAKGRLAGLDTDGLAELGSGEGRIVRIDGRIAAAFRDEEGVAHVLSATCPHLGCIVAWNEAERTWDCPCHGSRFQAKGELMSGPAEKPLERLKSCKGSR
jgi:glycine/D-amino acid oxidase-like deaminating enzyme/nitrite reductase/ring-hydroxylating ferredoxin subunit